jgi:outer membrane protein
MRRLLLIALVFAFAWTESGLALAQSQEDRRGPPRRSVGLGVLASPNPYRDASTEVFPIPVLVLRGEQVSFVGLRLSVHLVEQGPWSLDAIAQPRFGGFDPADSAFLEGMEEREFTLDAGLELTWESPRWSVSFDVLRDVLSRSDGLEMSVDVQRSFAYARWRISPGFGVGWQDDELADYYYGVRPAEARAGRPTYDPGSTLVPSVGIEVARSFPNPRWSVRGIIDVELLPSAVTNSPIIEDDYSAFAVAAVAYSF